jgi:hypothetical protein
MSRSLRLVSVALLLLGVALLLWLRHRGAAPPAAPVPARALATPSRSRGDAPVRLSGGNVERLVEAPDFVLEARVLSTRDGAGIAGATVTLSGAGVVSDAQTDGEGRLVWRTGKHGPWQVAGISAAGYTPFAPELGHSPVVFNAQPGVRITGVSLFLTPVRAGDAGATEDDDEDEGTDAGVQLDGGAGSARVVGAVREQGSGRPIAAFTIIAATRRGGVERGDRRTGSFLDADGHYALAVRPGSQCVVAYALGYAAAAERCIDVAAGAEARVDFELPRGARISGRVIDRGSRAAIAGARVSLENPNAGAATPLPVIASAETDADGRFQLSGTDTGLRSIFVTARGHHSRVIPGLQLEADRDAPSIEIDLLATEPGEEPSIESAGINAVVAAQGDTLVLGKCTPLGGADQAGLKAGDVLVAVDGIALATLGMQAGIEHLRGPEGSTVVVTIRRPPEEGTRDVVVTRRRVVNR